MLFHFIFLFWDLNTYKRILKDYPLRTKNTSFSLPISSFTRDYAGIQFLTYKSALIAHSRYVKILT